MEKVYEMSARPEFDLVVLDTPPSAHALDFLEAPERLIGMLDSRLVQLLLHPALSAGRLGLRLFQRGAHQAFALIERITGFGFLEDVSEFLLAFEGMSEGFRRRARGGAAAAVRARHGLRARRGRERRVGRARARPARAARGARRAAWWAWWPTACALWPDGAPPLPAPEERDGVARAARARVRARSTGDGVPARERAREAALAVLDGYAAARRARRARRRRRCWPRLRCAGCFVRRIPELPRDVHDLDGLAGIERARSSTSEQEKP